MQKCAQALQTLLLVIFSLLLLVILGYVLALYSEIGLMFVHMVRKEPWTLPMIIGGLAFVDSVMSRQFPGNITRTLIEICAALCVTLWHSVRPRPS